MQSVNGVLRSPVSGRSSLIGRRSPVFRPPAVGGRPSAVVLLILLSALTGFADDNKCSLKLADLPVAPELAGFRMGMTTEQVKIRVPQVALGRANEFEVSKTSINPDFDPRIDKPSFAGVRTVSLDFLDGRITSLWLGYDGSFKWQTVDDFVKGISQSLRLPDAWTLWRTRGRQIRCADFHMTVSVVAEGPSFRIVDDDAEQTIAARREAKEAEATASEEASEEIIADKKVKLYYRQGCDPEKEIKESDRVVFKTKDEAEQAGYKAAKQCE
jgi:hypothetical protein